MPTIEELAQNDAGAGKNMADDPNWSSEERQKYQSAYNGAKERQNQAEKY